jgi:hypothetical protein
MSSKRIVSEALVVLQLVVAGAFAQESQSRDTMARAEETELQDVLDLTALGSQGGEDKEADAFVEPTLAAAVAPQCFTSGSGPSYLKICISARGTIAHFESPQGSIHITGREGHVLCADSDFFSPVGFDAGNAEGGWAVASVSQPSGAGTLPLIVTRRSLDGHVQLKQTFTRNTLDVGVDIKMEVKNLSAAALTAVQLHRYGDLDVEQTAGNDEWRRSIRGSVWATGPPTEAQGDMVMLTTTSNAFFTTVNTSERFGTWNPLGSGAQSARICVAFATNNFVGDGVARIRKDLGDIAPGATKTVTFRYRRF